MPAQPPIQWVLPFLLCKARPSVELVVGVTHLLPFVACMASSGTYLLSLLLYPTLLYFNILYPLCIWFTYSADISNKLITHLSDEAYSHKCKASVGLYTTKQFLNFSKQYIWKQATTSSTSFRFIYLFICTVRAPTVYFLTNHSINKWWDSENSK
jgi:hypothetical protein